MWNPSVFFISNKFYRTQNKFGPLNNHMFTEFSLVVTMVTGNAQHCHLVVTSLVTVVTIKKIVNAGYLPYQIR